MDKDAVLALMRRDVTPEEYSAIRDLWKRHSIAEDRRDLDGLISTLTEDCVYEVVNTGGVWHGHEGARKILHGAPVGLSRRHLHADPHRDRPAGRVRGSDPHRHAQGHLAGPPTDGHACQLHRR